MAVEKQAGEGQYLTFRLEEEIYALEITKVREVLDYTKVTKVPKTPPFVKGVINLRGKVVPVVDLRLKFGMGETRQSIDTCIIIGEILLDNEYTQLGVLADQVQEVLELDPSQIEPAPKIGARLDTEFINGMGKHNDEFIIILNIEKVFSLKELAVVQQVAGSSGSTLPQEENNQE